MNQEFLLAVDGGGTKTQALITDLEGHVVARGIGPSSNIHRVGLEQSGRALATAIEGALQYVVGDSAPAGQPAWRRTKIVAACFGLAGVDCPEDEREISHWVREQGVTPSFQVLNDSELILAAGTPDGWGIALISGTGSVCLGRTAEGRTVRVGGWGGMLGDEGSGYVIALRALQTATQTADGRANATGLLDAILRHWSLPDAQALIRHVHGAHMTQTEIATLATVVTRLATEGEDASNKIIHQAASDLALHIDTVVRRLGLKRPPLALAGGVLRGCLRAALDQAIQSELGPVQFVSDPSLGAVVLARRLATTPTAGAS
jgi:N-acetylglucosamine kinase-like BadF-type ATPase